VNWLTRIISIFDLTHLETADLLIITLTSRDMSRTEIAVIRARYAIGRVVVPTHILTSV